MACRFLKILVQEFNVRLDKGFVLSLLDLFESMPKNESNGTTTLKRDFAIIRAPLIPSPDCVDPKTSNFYMFEYVHLSPVKVSVKFSCFNFIFGMGVLILITYDSLPMSRLTSVSHQEEHWPEFRLP